MNESWLVPDPIAVGVLGLTTAIIGLVGLLERPAASKWSLSSALALVFLLVSAGGLAAGQPRMLCLAGAAPSAAWCIVALARKYHLVLLHILAACLQGARFHAALLLIVGPLLAGIWALRSGEPDDSIDLSQRNIIGLDLQPPLIAATVRAHTDRNQAVPVFAVLEEGQAQPGAKSTVNDHWLRLPGEDHACNCHGWVFTGGRFWVDGRDVPKILLDNGYIEASTPRSGDLVIYRDDDGNVIHTGLVRVADQDLTLIESKMGHQGRYLHAPHDQSYATTWTFYRSPRQGHHLTFEEAN